MPTDVEIARTCRLAQRGGAPSPAKEPGRAGAKVRRCADPQTEYRSEASLDTLATPAAQDRRGHGPQAHARTGPTGSMPGAPTCRSSEPFDRSNGSVGNPPPRAAGYSHLLHPRIQHLNPMRRRLLGWGASSGDSGSMSGPTCSTWCVARWLWSGPGLAWCT